MILKPIEAIYQLASAAKNFLYDKEIFKSVKVSPSVISIGNLSFGGTGKTPCIQFLATELSTAFKVAVVCRSYKAQLKAARRVDLSEPDRAHVFGDEACLLQATLPQCQVWSGPQKYLTAQAAADHGNPDIILIDDGFSHRQLRREFDLVLVDTSFLNHDYFRESLKSLKRANAILLTKTQAATPEMIAKTKSKILKFAPHLQHAVFSSNTETQVDLPTANPLFVFCGLAKPISFRSSLVKLGFDIIQFSPLDDHFDYTGAAEQKILKEFLELKKLHPKLCLVTTEKDFVKLTNSDLLKQLHVAKYRMVLDAKQKVGLLEKIRSHL